MESFLIGVLTSLHFDEVVGARGMSICLRKPEFSEDT